MSRSCKKNKHLLILSDSANFKMKPAMKNVLRKEIWAWLVKNLLLVFTMSGVVIGVAVGLLLR